MQVSMWSSFFHDLTPEEAVNALQQCGFDSAELSSEHGDELLKRGDAVKSGREFAEYCRERGFSTPQGHFDLGGNLAAEDPAEAAAYIANIKRWCDLFEAAGVRYGVLHGCTLPGKYYKLTNERTRIVAQRIGEIVEYCSSRNYQLTVCLENLIVNYNSFDELEELAGLTPGGEKLGFCLDTGHLMLAQNGGHGDFIRRAGSRLKALHITDVIGENNDHALPYIGGRCNWDEIVGALREVNYQNLFNYEIPLTSFGVPLEIRKMLGKYACELACAMVKNCGKNL